jgi:hypothetical protein
MENCGTLIIEEPGGPLIETCNLSAELHTIPYENLSNLELRGRYSQFRLASDNTVGWFAI